MKIIQNPNKKEYEEITNAVLMNDGYCPCMPKKNADTKCMCKNFRDQTEPGKCHCGRFIKIN